MAAKRLYPRAPHQFSSAPRRVRITDCILAIRIEHPRVADRMVVAGERVVGRSAADNEIGGFDGRDIL